MLTGVAFTTKRSTQPSQCGPDNWLSTDSSSSLPIRERSANCSRAELRSNRRESKVPAGRGRPTVADDKIGWGDGIAMSRGRGTRQWICSAQGLSTQPRFQQTRNRRSTPCHSRPRRGYRSVGIVGERFLRTEPLDERRSITRASRTVLHSAFFAVSYLPVPRSARL